MRAARWETAPIAYCASAPARTIGRLCDGKAPKPPNKKEGSWCENLGLYWAHMKRAQKERLSKLNAIDIADGPLNVTPQSITTTACAAVIAYYPPACAAFVIYLTIHDSVALKAFRFPIWPAVGYYQPAKFCSDTFQIRLMHIQYQLFKKLPLQNPQVRRVSAVDAFGRPA
jgi:hypothetical protein